MSNLDWNLKNHVHIYRETTKNNWWYKFFETDHANAGKNKTLYMHDIHVYGSECNAVSSCKNILEWHAFWFWFFFITDYSACVSCKLTSLLNTINLEYKRKILLSETISQFLKNKYLFFIIQKLYYTIHNWSNQ